ncbi:MAG TPA: 6-pyruvoyl-tetrahydropterin synthase-related protein, partial [Candidatus Omnitrophota bacterium]|nr:6-pyruvoyl-tetrahydropterin synthase-related protein [Candidatus Omnitrophota bacterium]
GYVMFNFYQPLFSYLAAFLTWIFHHPVLGLNSACFIVVFLSGVAMYIAVKDWFGHDAALVSAIAYLFSPYHILELYVRAAYAELTSFIFFPLILWALYRLSKTFQRRYFILGIVFLSGLILAHQLSNFIFFPFMIGYLLFLCGAEPKTYSNQYLFLSLLMIFLAFSITSFFWVPALLEKKFVNMDILVKGQFNYRWHFLYPYQLFKARWNYGYSCPGPYDGMDFHLGYAHILLVIISFVFFIKKYKDSKQVVKFFIIFAVMAIIAVFFTLPFSSRIWERIPLMHFVQFPWRYLMIVSFAISVLVGAWAFFKIPYQKYFLAFAIGLIFLINISYCHPPTSKNIDFQKGFDSGRYNSPLDHVEFISIWTKRV